MNADDVRIYLRLVAVAAIVGVLWFLSLVLAREWVKDDLKRKGLRAIRVRWRPFSWWPVWGPAFQVLYADASGFVHEAQCGLPAWRRPVVWRKDEVVDVA